MGGVVRVLVAVGIMAIATRCMTQGGGKAQVIEKFPQFSAHFQAWDDAINKSAVEQEFRGLKAFG